VYSLNGGGVRLEAVVDEATRLKMANERLQSLAQEGEIHGQGGGRTKSLATREAVDA